MSDISELAYSARWMDGLEHALWGMLLGGSRDYGRHTVSDRELLELRSLSEACGGWIRYDNDLGEQFVATGDWKEKYFQPSTLGR